MQQKTEREKEQNGNKQTYLRMLTIANKIKQKKKN